MKTSLQIIFRTVNMLIAGVDTLLHGIFILIPLFIMEHITNPKN